MAIPVMERELGYSKTELGLIVSSLQIVYGLGKFGNGILADRANPRFFMAAGLLLSAAVNICFGLAESLAVLAVLWGLNGWFQSMGFPSGARLLSHWFAPSEYGRIWGIWGCSHQVGTAVILVIAGYLVQRGWSSAFLAPGVFAVAVVGFLLARLRDVPSTMGLPPVELYRGEITDRGRLEALEEPLGVTESLRNHVLNRGSVWAVAFGNFFLYIARYGALTWAPAFIAEVKGATITRAGWTMAAFEVLGILGMLSAGWISDRLLQARRGPIMSAYMLLLAFGLYAFWSAPAGAHGLYTLALALCGFLVYGPLMLVSVAVAGFAGKKSAATAAGFAGLWGYLGAVISGVGAGWVIDAYGWGGGFALFIASAVLSAFCFALTWKVRPRAYTNGGEP
jgi:sugar phosphate permease